jgi:hypothetical protein
VSKKQKGEWNVPFFRFSVHEVMAISWHANPGDALPPLVFVSFATFKHHAELILVA